MGGRAGARLGLVGSGGVQCGCVGRVPTHLAGVDGACPCSRLGLEALQGRDMCYKDGKTFCPWECMCTREEQQHDVYVKNKTKPKPKT